MTKNADTHKYKYQGHGIGFDLTGTFTHQDGSAAKNVIIFGVNMTNSKNMPIIKQKMSWFWVEALYKK